MKIQVTFKHMDHSDWIQEYATNRSEKLKKYFEGKVSVIWNLTIEKKDHIAHCHITGNHIDLFGESDAQNVQEAIDSVVAKLDKQLKRHKEIVTNHHSKKITIATTG